MKRSTKLFTVFSLVLLAALVFAPAALAFDGRSGDRIVIAKGEVINEDLYLGGREIIVDGTINGDLMAAAETVIINGTVTGDLWAGGSRVTINGEVGDDVFAGASVVTLGSKAKVADDFFGGAASVETAAGSQIGGDLLIGAFQGLVSGSVTDDLMVGSSRLRLEGKIGGDAMLAVDSAENASYYGPMYFGPDRVAMPPVPAGLTFGDAANVAGKLEYTSPVAVSVPSSIADQVQHKLPPVDAKVSKEIRRSNGTTTAWLDAIRRIIALLLVGLVVARFAPAWILKPAAKLQSRPWVSLLVGVVGAAALPVVMITALIAVALIAVLFGALTLGNLAGMVVALGLPGWVLALLTVVVWLSYIPQAIIAYVLGRWILQRTRPALTESIYWPLLLGLLILGVLMAIPVAGGILQSVVMVLGLGALLLLLERQAPATQAPVPA